MFIGQLQLLEKCVLSSLILITGRILRLHKWTGKDREMGSSDNTIHANSGVTYTSVQYMAWNM